MTHLPESWQALAFRMARSLPQLVASRSSAFFSLFSLSCLSSAKSIGSVAAATAAAAAPFSSDLPILTSGLSATYGEPSIPSPSISTLPAPPLSEATASDAATAAAVAAASPLLRPRDTWPAGSDLDEDPPKFGFVGLSSAASSSSSPRRSTSSLPTNKTQEVRHLASTCSEAQDCTSCAQLYPSCTWCGSSGTCLDTSDAIIEHMKNYSDVHVLYSEEEFYSSYGFLDPAQHLSDDDRCEAWVYREASCSYIEDYCGYYSSCGTCTGHSACGYCWSKDSGGTCVPGTASGQIVTSSSQQKCGDVSSTSEEATSSWFFGNWSGWESSGREAWDPVCVETCHLKQASYNTSSGEITLGSRIEQFTYGPDANCSWRVAPASWPADHVLFLYLRLDSLVAIGDTVVISNLASSDSWTPLREVGYLGCRSSDDSCYVRNSLAATAPVLIEFVSSPEGSEWAGSSWTISWEFVTTSDIRAIAEGYDASPLVTSLFLWFGVGLLIVPLCCAALILRMGCVRRRLWDEETAVPIAFRIPGRRRESQDFGIDAEVLEQHVPTTKCIIIEASDENTEKGEHERLCSVCLSELEPGDKARRLPCNHLFHQPCIDDWLDRKAACPVCRQQVVPGNLRSLVRRQPVADSPSSVGSTSAPSPDSDGTAHSRGGLESSPEAQQRDAFEVMIDVDADLSPEAVPARVEPQPQPLAPRAMEVRHAPAQGDQLPVSTEPEVLGRPQSLAEDQDPIVGPADPSVVGVSS